MGVRCSWRCSKFFARIYGRLRALPSRARAGYSFLKSSRGLVVFRAGDPFIFLIRDTHTEVALFIGRLMNPPVSQ